MIQTKYSLLTLLILLPLLGVGCFGFGEDEKDTDDVVVNQVQPASPGVVPPNKDPNVALPVDQYGARRTYKLFGEYFSDRFTGYHIADDIEYGNVTTKVPVRSIAAGTIRKIGPVSGYGGVIAIEHTIDQKQVTAIYGHLDLGSSDLSVGDTLGRGQFLAHLGENKSTQTDGERKHLHFALYEGSDERLQGYEPHPEEVIDWLNPDDFFAEQGILIERLVRTYDAESDLGGNQFKLAFTIPAGWDVEYVPSIRSLNLYEISGEGTARERSQMFIRYFDAADFLTLSTVGIFSRKDLEIGKNNLDARRYDIEKRSTVEPFRDQPIWRNERHIVTDFRDKKGQTRYYVVAANPDLDMEIYEAILASMEIISVE